MEKSARDGLLKYGEHLVNLSKLDKTKITISCDFPLLEAVDVKPKNFISEKDGLKIAKLGGETKDTALHFFAPDYRLDAIFNKIWSGMAARYCPPEFWDDIASYKGKAATRNYMDKKWEDFQEYLDALKKFDIICSPDHSVYGNWSNPNNIADVWRNRVTGQVFQREGFIVIPTISWAGIRSYEYAFLGVEPGGTYATSCIGCNDHSNRKREDSLLDFRNGIREMVKRLHPKRIIVYGSGKLPDADYGNCDVMFFVNQESIRGNDTLRAKLKEKKEGESNNG